MARETVHLDRLDGFEFEKLCERILSRLLHSSSVERIGGVADRGRDLLIRGDGGVTVVECKHYMSATVGRPVIQKLHSACITSGASKGIVITTGKYSKSAREEAAAISDIRMELWDMGRLASAADSAGIALVVDGGTASVRYWPSPSGAETAARVAATMRHKSHPRPVSEILGMDVRQVTLEPYYLVRADVSQEFNTATYHIHSVDERGLAYAVRATDGKVVGSNWARRFAATRLSDTVSPEMPECPVERQQFSVGIDRLHEIVREQIIDDYSSVHSYKGRNGRTYTKDCEIGPRSVQITDTTMALAPVYLAELDLVGRKYSGRIISGNDDAVVDCAPLWTCCVCEKPAKDDALLCNACGAVSHAPKRWKPHGFECRSCEKTICRPCAYWKRRLLFFKAVYCKDCSTEHGAKSRF